MGSGQKEHGHREHLKDECGVRAGRCKLNDRADSRSSILRFRCDCSSLRGWRKACLQILGHTWPDDRPGTRRAKGPGVQFYVSVPDRQIVLLWKQRGFPG